MEPYTVDIVCGVRRRALKDKGVTFHPDVALQAMEDVKRRRQERVAAAAEVTLSAATVEAEPGRMGRGSPRSSFVLSQHMLTSSHTCQKMYAALATSL